MNLGTKNVVLGQLLVAGLLATVVPALGLLTALPAAADSISAETHRFLPVCAAPLPGHATCLSVADVDGVMPLATGSATPQGFGPSDLQSAYKLPATTSGTGPTVAIVDAYDLPTAQEDLNTYRAQYGLPACGAGCFTKVDQNGSNALPKANDGWAQEIALDLAMVSSSCPNCKILLLEAASSDLTDLGTAVNTAVRLGAVAVSNSYGGRESAANLDLDTRYFNHPGVAITASSGDDGYGTAYPAGSQYVTAVGGTSLVRDSSTRGFSETAWKSAGSGCSGYDDKPSWQVDTGCTKRTISDVSAVADPATGVAVYLTIPSTGRSGWTVFGGTSASAPLIAGIYALAPAPTANSKPASFPYSTPTALFDVTNGSTGSCGTYECNAGPGYDGPTGLGTPNGIAAFSEVATPEPSPPSSPPHKSSPPSSSPIPQPISGSYMATNSVRVADTRVSAGAISAVNDKYTGGPLAANISYRLGFTQAGIKTGQAAYVFNVTAINPGGVGNLRIAPGSSPAPETSLINYQPRKDVANLVIVPNLAGDGVDTLQLYSAAASVDVAVDLVGYYPAAMAETPAPITSVTPSRIADTRPGGTTLNAGQTRSFQVGGSGGIPASGAKAVALNVTAVNPRDLGNLRIFADGAALPTTSNISFIPHQDKSAFVIVNLPANGKIDVYSAGTTVDVTIDAYASFDQIGSNLVVSTPTRVFDSRPDGTLPAGGSTDVQITGTVGVPANAQAVLVSLTAIHTSGSTGVGNLRIYPTGGNTPKVSTLNYVSPTADVTNFAIVQLGIDGRITINTQGTLTDIAVDVLGYVPAG